MAAFDMFKLVSTRIENTWRPPARRAGTPTNTAHSKKMRGGDRCTGTAVHAHSDNWTAE